MCSTLLTTMGISHFFSYISNIKGVKNRHQLRNTSVVIDGSNIYFLLYQDFNSSQRGLDYKFGGNYDGYRKYCRNFFEQLKKCGISPLIVMDGLSKYSSTDFDKRMDNLKKLNRYESLRPLLLEEVFVETVVNSELEYLQTAYDSDPDLAKLANQLKRAIISSDSDFYCFDVEEGVISFNDLEWTKPKPLSEDSKTNEFYIDCQIFKYKEFVTKFPGLTTTMMPVFASIFSNDFTTLYEIFEDFLVSIVEGSSDKRMVNGWNNNKYKKFNKSLKRMERIDRFLKWLSRLNGEQNFAINRLKSYIDRREMDENQKQEVVATLNNALAAYQCSEDNDTYLAKILDLKRKAGEGGDQLLRQTLIDYKVLDSDCQSLPDHILHGFFIEDRVPVWVFRLTNRGLTIELKLLVEDLTQDSVNESSIDLIKIMSGLLRFNDDVAHIKLQYRKGMSFGSEEVSPAIDCMTKSGQKSLPKVSQLTELSQEDRKELLLDILGVDVKDFDLSDKFKEDYEFWKYLVFSIKYWQKKTKTEDKSKLINGLIVSAIYYKFEDNIQSEELKKLTEEKPNEDDFDIKIVHYFNEFQVVYRFIDCIHSLLGHPFGRNLLASSLNGVLISRLIKTNDQISFASEELDELKDILIGLFDD